MAAEQHVENEENQENNRKRKREASVLDNFTKLINGQEKIRVKGGVDLLRYLTENKNPEKAGEELKYALGRLIRGLGSSKVHAKAGFFAALVSLFNLENISLSDIFEYVAKELHTGGSNSKSENADICSGQILIAGTILRSCLYENCSDDDKKKVLELLLNAGKERTYLNLASYKFLCDLFEKISPKEFERVIFPVIKSELSKPWQEQNLDNLYLLLEVQRCFPESLHTKFLKNNLGTEEILCSESLRHVAHVLMTVPRLAALKHPVFDLFVRKISESDLIEQFFDELDGTLVRSNRNKYFVFTKLLTGVLEIIDETSIIPNILTTNYIQQTISMHKNSVGKQKDKEFKEITLKLFETLLNSLKKDEVKSKTKIKILKRLLFYPGTFIFEKVTKSRLIQNITGTLDPKGVKKLGEVYRDVIVARNDKIVNEKVTERWWNTDRVYASHLLVKLVNHPTMHEESDWKIEQLMFLGKIGLLRDQSETIGNELADSLKETFYSSLDLKLTRLNDLRLILSRIFHEFDNIITNNDVLRHPLQEETYQIWKKTAQLVTKLDSNSKKKNAVFHTLFLNLGLQLLNSSNLASDSLTELFSCYERTKKSKKNGEASSEDPLWIEVVTDLFLNLLSHNSHLLRNVINCVFPHLCKYLNANAIHHVLSVLDPKNESNPLTKDEQSSDDENDDDEEDENDSSQEEDEEEEDNEEETVNDKLRMALHQALGIGAESDAESVDLDALDDEEGEKLNEALGQAFKQFRPNLGKIKKQRKDDETLTHFRIRVLDLIEIYLNSNPSMMLVLEIMLPLLQLLEFCIKDEHQKPLEIRVKACLKKLTSLKKFDDSGDVTEEILVNLLKSLLEKGTKNVIVIQEMGEKIADCSIFLITCSQALSGVQNGTTHVIKEGLEAFFTRRDCIIPYVLFKNLLQMNWDGILQLVPFLTGCVFAHAVRPFRRSQAIELLKIFCHNQRFISTNLNKMGDIEEHVVNFLRDSVDFFREFNANPTQRKVKEKYIGNLFELLHCIKNSVLAKNFDTWDVLGDVVRACRSQLTLSKDTKTAFNKLCRSLNVSNIVQMQQKTVKLKRVEDDQETEIEQTVKKRDKKKKMNGVHDEDAHEKQEKKKKKVDNAQLKLKKNSKEMRLQSLSEGLYTKRKFNWDEIEDGKKAKTS